MSYKDFPLNPVNSKSHRKPVLGVGINDAWYVTTPRINGKRCPCPIYKIWMSVMWRVYSDKFQESFPVYVGVTLSKDWHSFSNFREWVLTQDWEGKELDKDILVPGNKHYSATTCVFVDHNTNMVLIGMKRNTRFPTGVHQSKSKRRYNAVIGHGGKTKHLGSFGTPEEAGDAYKKAKYSYLIDCASTQSKRIADGLIRHANLLLV